MRNTAGQPAPKSFAPRLGERATWGALPEPATCTYVERGVCNGRPTGLRRWEDSAGRTYCTTGNPGFTRV